MAPTATLIGDVVVEAGASVWFNAVLRGDYGPIVVREGANVQDGSVLHAPPGIPVDIGPGATVAHMCVIHGVHVGPEALIANHATVLDGAVIGARSLIAAHSLVTAGTQIPAGVLAVGAPAQVKGPIAGTGAEMWINSTRRPTANWLNGIWPDSSRSRPSVRAPSSEVTTTPQNSCGSIRPDVSLQHAGWRAR